MANRPHTLTAQELKAGASITGQADASVLAQVLGADVLSGSVRIIPDTEVVHQKYTLIEDNEIVIIDPSISVDVYINFVIQSDIVLTRDTYGFITSVSIAGSVTGNELLIVKTISMVHVPGEEYPSPILQDGYSNAFTFFTAGAIQNGTTIEHRTLQGARFNTLEIFCSTAPNADVDVSITKDGIVVASGTLSTGERYVSVDMEPGFISGPVNELKANITTTTSAGTNLRIRIK